MTKMKRKISGAARFAVLLMLAIAALASPGWATDYEANNATQLAEVAQQANNNDTATVQSPHVITLITGTYELTQTLKLNNYIKLVGNGATLSLAPSATGSVIYIPGQEVIINDLTITNGKNDKGKGGGIDAENCTLTVNNCTFKNNACSGTSDGVYYPGGGGIFALGCTLTVTNCRFEDNSTSNYGGGINFTGNHTLTVTNCRFERNTAPSGSNIYCTGESTINQCTFSKNNVNSVDNDNNVDVYVMGPSTNGEKTAAIENCTFAEDRVCLTGKVNANYCTFIGKSSTDTEIECDTQNGIPAVTIKNSIVFGKYPDNDNNFTLDTTSCVTLDSAPTSEDVAGQNGVKHVVFRKYAELYNAFGKCSEVMTTDQLGEGKRNKRDNDKFDAGAAQIDTDDFKFSLQASDTPWSVVKEAEFSKEFTLTPNPAALSYDWTVTAPTPAPSSVKASAIDDSKRIFKLSGTPSELKEYTYTITATEKNTKKNAETTVKLIVSTNIATVSGDVSFSGSVGVDLGTKTATFSVTEPKSTYQWSVEPESSNGVTAQINPTTGVLTLAGRPKEKKDATFQVTAKDGSVSGHANVTVNVGDAVLQKLDVSLNSTSLTVTHGSAASQTLTATVTGTYSDGKTTTDVTSNCDLKWSTPNNTYGITLSETGTLTVPTGLDVTGEGYTVPVTVTAKYNDQTAGIADASVTQGFTVTVTQETLTSIDVTIDTKDTTLARGGTLQLTATVKGKYSNGSTGTPAATLNWAVTLPQDGSITFDTSTSTLKVADNAAEGEHEVQVAVTATANATATSDSSKTARDPKEGTKTLTITVTGGSAPETVATPTFSPAAGTFTSAQNVTISCTTSDATIYYTTDGKDPTTSSTQYGGLISVSSTSTLKAFAIKGDAKSAVASATYTINTTVPVTGVTLKTLPSLTVGGTETLTYNVEPSNATNKKVTWKSSNTKVATVDQNGTVKGVSLGTATITVTTEDGGFTQDCKVTVTAPSGSIDLHFLMDPITMTVEQAGYAERMFISRRDYACDYVLDGQKASLAPNWSLESGPSWLRINEGVLVADLRKSDVKPGEYTGTLRATASYNGATATATAQVKVTVTGYTELEVTAPDAVMVVYPGCPESRLDLKPLITVKGKHSSRGWETVSYSSREIDQSGTWPSWLTIEDFVAVGKAPAGTEPGKYEYKYNVTVNKDNMFGTGTQKLIVYVSAKSELEPAKIAMDSDALPYAQEGSPYSARIYTTGDEPIRWVVDNNTPLPDGLTLNESTGEISGTPTQKDVGQIKGSLVYVSNPANANNPDQRYFLISVRGVPPSDWRITRNPVRVSKGETFDITFKVQQGRSVYYSTVEYPDKQYLKKAIAQNASEAGEGSIKYTCVWPEKKEQKYKFQVKATNKYGWSTKSKIVTVLSTGKIKSAAGDQGDDDFIITVEDDEDSETYEMFPDGYTPDFSGYTEDVTYFHNGYVMSDDEGKTFISAVIGTAAPGVEGADYVYATVADLLSAQNLNLADVVALEFRQGATVDVSNLVKLKNLKEIAIDECDVTTLDLSENMTLTSLSLYGCEKLTSLNVSGCSSLKALSVAKCPKLVDVKVDKCDALEGVNMTGTAATELSLSSLKALANVNVNGCTDLKMLDVRGCSSLAALDASNTGLVVLYAEDCLALADVDLNSTDIAEVDLSSCSGLKSLSLAGAPALTELKLPGESAVEEITLTGSKVYSLPLSGSTSLISLDLNGSMYLKDLDLSGCSALKELDVSHCVNLSTLNLSGCSALEKLAATGCVSLTALNIAGGRSLRELSVGGANFLESLEVSGQALGHLDLDGLTMLAAPDCEGQIISGVPMSRTLDMKNYVGNGLSRVTEIHGYAADNTEIACDWNTETGIATFASVPDTVIYFYNTAGLNNKTMDVTLTLNGAPDDTPTSDLGSGGCDGLSGGLGLAVLALLGFGGVLPRRGRKGD